MGPSRAILSVILLGLSPAGAEELDCNLLERLLGADQVESLKGATLGFNVWRSEVTLEGFDRCRIRDIPSWDTEGPTYQPAIECDVRTRSSETAGRLARGTIEALTIECGRRHMVIASTFGEAGFMALDPSDGLGLETVADERLFDFSAWRSELRQGLDETTIPRHRLVLTILIPEAP